MSALILALQRVDKAGVNEHSGFTGALEKERDGRKIAVMGLQFLQNYKKLSLYLLSRSCHSSLVYL